MASQFLICPDSANPSDPNETSSPGDPDGNDPTTAIIPPPPHISSG
ncbi:MAG: hypothetical protein IPP37_07070 [Saprospiraceae bacterium]|nr:hypothetical protein [Saprospiraceae bacterium]